MNKQSILLNSLFYSSIQFDADHCLGIKGFRDEPKILNESVYFFTGPSSTTVKTAKEESPAKPTSAAVTPDKGPSQERHRLDQEAKGKPSISGTSFDPIGMKLDFF